MEIFLSPFEVERRMGRIGRPVCPKLPASAESPHTYGEVVTPPGLEPEMSGPKPDVLPLHHRASFVGLVLTKLARYKNRV